jgi:hypothetical protein
MTITKEQFVRGFNALRVSYARRQAVNEALDKENDFGCDIGSDPTYSELIRQLEDRCRCREDAYGDWPEDSCGETDIEIALMDRTSCSVTDEQGNRIDFPSTAEGLWAWWERTKTGPFLPMRGEHLPGVGV